MTWSTASLSWWAAYRNDRESGDLIACGTNHEGLGALQDGERTRSKFGIGKMTLKVSDPLNRKWERGIYLGVDSTNPDAVRRHRPISRLSQNGHFGGYAQQQSRWTTP
jgi:hypothetical protein